MKEKFNFFDLINACILLLLTFILSKRYIFSGLGYDEHGYVSMGNFFLNGMVPYRDFFELKPILIILMNALGLKLFGLESCAFKYIEFVFLFATVLIFYLTLVWNKVSKMFSFLIVYYSAFLLLYSKFHYISLNDSETYGFIFSILFFCSISYKNIKEKKFYISCFLGGIFMALAFLSKEPFILSLIPISFLVFFDENSLKINSYRFTSIILGFISIMIVFLSYLLINNAFDGYIEKLDYSIAYSKQYGVIFKHNLVNRTFVETLLFNIKKLFAGYENLSVFLPLLGLYLYSIFSIKNSSKLAIYILSIFAGLYSISLGHLFFEKYFILGLFPIILFSLDGAKNISLYSSKNSKNHNLYLFIVTFTILSITYKTTACLLNETTTTYIPANLIDFQTETFKKRALPLVKRFTSKDDKVFFIGWMSMYACANRKPATKYYYVSDRALEINSKLLSSKERLEKLVEDLEHNLPKIIYVDEKWNKGEAINTYKNYIIPFIKKNNYLNCSNGLYLKRPSSGLALREATRFCNNTELHE